MAGTRTRPAGTDPALERALSEQGLTALLHGRAPALLTAQQEVDLARAAEAGALAGERLAAGQADEDAAALAELVAAGEEAFATLVLANVRLVAWAARRRGTHTAGLEQADLVAEGLRGLIRAVHKWDHTRGLKFSTYALPWIRSYQGRAVAAATGVPERVREQQRAVWRTREALTQELARTPTEDEVAAAVGLSAARIADLNGYRALAVLDAPRATESGGRPTTLGERLADPHAADPQAAADEAAPGLDADVARLLEGLSDREALVVSLRFGIGGQDPHTVAEIAAATGVERRHVDSVLTRALQRLRERHVGMFAAS